MSPVGVCAEIGEADVTHFEAATDAEWFDGLVRLLSDADLRSRMGKAARAHSLQNYNVPMHAQRLADAIMQVSHQMDQQPCQ